MNGRALLAIGCDKYDYLGPLTGAERDATSLFNALVDPKTGDYDPDFSTLLLSPRLDDVRHAIESMLFGAHRLDTLTVTFAGHGAMSAGSFYMATRDTKTNALSATALPLADLFRMVAEAAPKQTYVIIDACQAGGLISDLNVILKSEVMGELGTPGLALLATAASNQVAGEIAGQGVGTSAILECVRGDVILQDTNPALDLVEIGRAVSEKVSAMGGQTPVVWGLNLYGPSSFCRNPHADSGNAPLRSVLVGWSDRDTMEAVRRELPRLWEPYVTVAFKWDARRFLDQLSPLLEQMQKDCHAQIDLVRRLADACSTQAAGSKDRFREIEVRATCAVALLPFASDARIEAYLASANIEVAALIVSAVNQIAADLEAYEYALITGGLGDLFALPLRLSKLLGWAGYGVHAHAYLGYDLSAPSAALTNFIDILFKTYSLSLVAMSDAQAPYLLTVLTALAELGDVDRGESIFSHIFSSVVDCRGKVARADLDPSKVLTYLIMRHNGADKLGFEIVAQPSEVITVMMRTSSLFHLEDVVDSALHHLDQLPVTAYLPTEFDSFANSHIHGGINAIFQIGHDIWTVSDLETSWLVTAKPMNAAISTTCILASLLFPDRTPWFLMPEQN